MHRYSIARQFALLFTDARGRAAQASEWGSECLGAVLLTSTGGMYAVLDVSDHTAAGWLRLISSDQRINECEALGALLGICCFGHVLEGFDIMHFVDSTAAEGALIKGLSRSQTLSAIAGAYWMQAGLRRICSWIGRVPSVLNVADGPSRGDLSEVQAHGWAPAKAWLPVPSAWSVLLQLRDWRIGQYT